MKKRVILFAFLLLLSGCAKTDDSAAVSPHHKQIQEQIALSPSSKPMPEEAKTNKPEDENFQKYEQMKLLEEIWQGYTPEQAARDGCVVFFWNHIESNEEVWEEFKKQASDGYGAVRVINYFADAERLRDISQYDPLGEYDAVTYDIIYEDRTCTIRWYEGGSLQQYTRQDITSEELETVSAEPIFNKYGGDAELAKADGCVLVERSTRNVIHGSDTLSKFFAATVRRGEYSLIRIAFLDDGSVCSVQECAFDGERYTVTSCIPTLNGSVEKETKSYSYMIKDMYRDDMYYYLLLRKEYKTAGEVVWEPIISSVTEPQIYYELLGRTT